MSDLDAERPPRRKPSVLVADDDAGVRQLVATMLSRTATVSPIADGTQAIAAIEAAPHLDGVVSDFSMPGADGLAVLACARGRFPNARLVLMSGDVTAELRRASEALGASVVEKPLDARALARLAELCGCSVAPTT